MFGCELPVAAMSFPALPELVIDGENGLVFNSPEQLAEVFLQLVSFCEGKGDISHDFYRFLCHGFKILLASRAPRVTKLSEEISRSPGSWVGRRIGTR